MRNFLLLTSLCLLSAIQEIKAQNYELSFSGNPTSIDQFDTVIFDLSQYTINGQFISFPVQIKSDDIVNSVDFECKFNNQKVQYDSLINNYLPLFPQAYFNINDSTLRYTSYCLQFIPNLTNLSTLRFSILSGVLFASDLYDIVPLLNGIPCSYKIIPPAFLGVDDYKENSKIHVYPNPASHSFCFVLDDAGIYSIFDINGEIVIPATHVKSNSEINVDVRNKTRGVYYLSIKLADGRSSFQPIILQ